MQLKTTPIYQLTVLAVESLGRLNWVLCRVSRGCSQGVAQAGLSPGGSGEESDFRCFQVVGRIQLLVVVGLRSLFSHRDWSQLLEAVLRSWLHDSLLCQSQEEPSLVVALSCLESL